MTTETRRKGQDAKKRCRASLPSMAHAHIRPEAQTPFHSLPGSLVNDHVGQVFVEANPGCPDRHAV